MPRNPAFASSILVSHLVSFEHSRIHKLCGFRPQAKRPQAMASSHLLGCISSGHKPLWHEIMQCSAHEEFEKTGLKPMTCVQLSRQKGCAASTFPCQALRHCDFCKLFSQQAIKTPSRPFIYLDLPSLLSMKLITSCLVCKTSPLKHREHLGHAKRVPSNLAKFADDLIPHMVAALALALGLRNILDFVFCKMAPATTVLLGSIKLLLCDWLNSSSLTPDSELLEVDELLESLSASTSASCAKLHCLRV